MDKSNYYEIRIKGHLDKTMTGWFEGLTVSNQEGGDALLAGHLADQAALQGILNQISHLGLTLISVNTVPEENENKKEHFECCRKYYYPGNYYPVFYRMQQKQ